MSPAPVRVGVLGCASIAWRRTLPAMVSVPGLTVAAVASRDPAKAAKFATAFDTEPVTGYEALLERDDIDAVYLPLPTGMHYEWAVRSLRAGKHVLCEKPLATNLAEATELVELAAKSGLVLRESFMCLYHHQHRRIRELLDVGVYPIRAAQLYLGPGVRVAGAALRYESGVDVAGGALLVSEDGVTAQLAFGFQHHYRNTYELWGSAGRIVLDRAYTPPNDWAPTIRIERADGVEELTLPPDDQFQAVTAGFARAVQAGAGTGIPDHIEDGGTAVLRQAALVDAVRDAARR